MKTFRNVPPIFAIYFSTSESANGALFPARAPSCPWQKPIPAIARPSGALPKSKQAFELRLIDEMMRAGQYLAVSHFDYTVGH